MHEAASPLCSFDWRVKLTKVDGGTGRGCPNRRRRNGRAIRASSSLWVGLDGWAIRGVRGGGEIVLLRVARSARNVRREPRPRRPTVRTAGRNPDCPLRRKTSPHCPGYTGRRRERKGGASFCRIVVTLFCGEFFLQASPIFLANCLYPFYCRKFSRDTRCHTAYSK